MIVQIVIGIVCLAFGAWMVLVLWPTRPVPLVSIVLGQATVGLAVAVGAVLLWRAALGRATHVRIRSESTSLVVDTYRWSRLVRSEHVARSSVERVFVEEKRGGRATTYRLVIATASGPLTFEAAGLGGRADYEKQAAELSAFLELDRADRRRARVRTASDHEAFALDAPSADDRAARHEKSTTGG